MPVELPVNLEAHDKVLGAGGAAGEAAGEEVADLAEAEIGGGVARGGWDGVLPRAAHDVVLDEAKCCVVWWTRCKQETSLREEGKGGGKETGEDWMLPEG